MTLIRICREVTDSRLAPRRLKMKHVRPEQPTAFKVFFGVEVEFGSDAGEIVLSASGVSLPTAGRDTHLHELPRRYAERALTSQSATRTSVRLGVERILPELLPYGKANATEVARRLGMSSRSLSRKLHDGGAAFAEILDELRKALAEHYLEGHELSVSEIAWLLGYQEVSSLTHAYKRWTGTTPRQFRTKTSGESARKTPGGRNDHDRWRQK